MQKRADGSVVKQKKLLCFMKKPSRVEFYVRVMKGRSGGAFFKHS